MSKALKLLKKNFFKCIKRVHCKVTTVLLIKENVGQSTGGFLFKIVDRNIHISSVVWITCCCKCPEGPLTAFLVLLGRMHTRYYAWICRVSVKVYFRYLRSQIYILFTDSTKDPASPAVAAIHDFIAASQHLFFSKKHCEFMAVSGPSILDLL